MNNSNILKAKKTFYTNLGVALGIVLLVLGIGVVPTFFGILRLKEENTRIQAEAASTEKQQQEIIALSRNQEEIEGKMAFVEQFFLTEASALRFIQELENLAKNHAVQLTLNITDPENAQAAFGEKNISLQVEGNWSDTVLFVRSLERQYPHITLGKLSAVPGTGSADKQNNVSVNVTATIPSF